MIERTCWGCLVSGRPYKAAVLSQVMLASEDSCGR